MNSQPTERFKPNASREMASMFDDVSGRYDLLNRVMTLGQDRAWRQAMWRAVPATATRVLDLCTGSGTSLGGLRRSGRTLLGMDVSLAMLHVAASSLDAGGWAPRLACADGFRLPLRAGALDAVTVAFGLRNLRPRREALAEIARVLVPGGTLCVLEATAPARGMLAPFARTWIRHVIPFAGRLSPDPSAYRYLSESIFEFGSGPEFEADLAATGFDVVGSHAFLFGAARLWVVRRGPALGQKTTEPPGVMQRATRTSGETAHARDAREPTDAEAATWLLVQAVTGTALTAALVWALRLWLKMGDRLPLTPEQRFVGWVLLIGGLIVFAVRSVGQWLRWSASRAGGVRSG